MIGHSREVLASLGIDVWISRGAVCQELSNPSIWRDQNTVELVMEQIPHHQPIIEKVPLLPDPIVSFESEKVLEQSKEKQLEPIIEQDVRPALKIESFNIQALVLPYLVILMEGSNITADQQLLWANIQRGIHAEFSELNWPFALPDLQDGYAVESYIQGFLDVISMDKNILTLGGIPHYQKSNITHLASLQEMLDEPLLKKRLWKFIQTKTG